MLGISLWWDESYLAYQALPCDMRSMFWLDVRYDRDRSSHRAPWNLWTLISPWNPRPYPEFQVTTCIRAFSGIAPHYVLRITQHRVLFRVMWIL